MIRKGRIILEAVADQLLLVELTLVDVPDHLLGTIDLPSEDERASSIIPHAAGPVPFRLVDDRFNTLDREPASIQVVEVVIDAINLLFEVSLGSHPRPLAGFAEPLDMRHRLGLEMNPKNTVLVDIELITPAIGTPASAVRIPLTPRVDTRSNVIEQMPPAHGPAVIGAVKVAKNLLPGTASLTLQVPPQRIEVVAEFPLVSPAKAPGHTLAFPQGILIGVLEITAIQPTGELFTAAVSSRAARLDDVFVQSFRVLHWLSCLGENKKSSQTVCRLHKSYATNDTKLAGTLAPANRYLFLGLTLFFHLFD